jgi:hypothetical protein
MEGGRVEMDEEVVGEERKIGELEYNREDYLDLKTVRSHPNPPTTIIIQPELSPTNSKRILHFTPHSSTTSTSTLPPSELL